MVDLNGSDGDGLDFIAAFVEDAGAKNITDTDATITDTENATLASLTLVVRDNPDGADESLTVGGVAVPLNADKTDTGTVGGTTFQVAYVAASLTFTVTKSSGSGAIGDFQTLLHGITYNNASNDPTTTKRGIDIKANDGAVDSSVATATITVGAVNDPPVLTGDLTATVLEAASYSITTNDLSYTDPDDVDAGVTFTVTNQTNGKIQVSGSDATSFTGTDLVAGLVTFLHDGSETTTASFKVSVEDGNEDSSTPTESTFNFTVTPNDSVTLAGTVLTVDGTASVDIITVAETGTLLTVVVNGVSANYTPASVTAININGYAGNDTITVNSLASGTALTADGGDNDDTLTVDPSVTVGTTLRGGRGNDTLTGGGGDDAMYGGMGDDTYVFGTASSVESDTVFEYLNQGTDTLHFSALATDVNLNLGSNAVQTVHANRTLKLNSSATFENAIGGSGNDTLRGNGLNNTLTGNAGNDLLVGSAGDDSLFGGLGDDRYWFSTATSAEADTVFEYLNQGTDTLHFSALATDVNLSLGSNAVQTVHANRTLKLNSSATFENAIGGSGNDTLRGNGLNNTLTGNAGNDLLVGSAGDDSLFGGLGDDRYWFSTATSAEADTVFEYSNQGADTLQFTFLATDVTLSLGSNAVQTVHANRTLKLNSSATFENAIGGSGNDTLRGNGLNNTLTGNAGNDLLVGNAGDDSGGRLRR